jgi:hypothetical protein
MKYGQIVLVGGLPDGELLAAIRHAEKMGVEVVIAPPPEQETWKITPSLAACIDIPAALPDRFRCEPWRKGRKDARFKGRG